MSAPAGSQDYGRQLAKPSSRAMTSCAVAKLTAPCGAEECCGQTIPRPKDRRWPGCVAQFLGAADCNRPERPPLLRLETSSLHRRRCTLTKCQVRGLRIRAA